MTQTTNLLEESRGENLSACGFGKDFLNSTQKAQTINFFKIDELVFSKV